MIKKTLLSFFVICLLSIMVIPAVFAADAEINSGDTAFMMISAALVLLMTPGLAFFYGGMVRKKNVLNTLMNSFIMMGVISVLWVVVGYSLAFGPDKGGLIGGFEWLGLNGVGITPHSFYMPTIPHMGFMAYQMMFAIITPALITGAFAERIKFSVLVAFTTLWSLLVYVPLAHWSWAENGWLFKLGTLDFAGGNVVHISSGVAGLVAAIVIGKRRQGGAPMLPHNIPFVLLGASLLWFGWFGFNAGSAGGASGLAVNAFVTTNTAAATAMLSWAIVEWIRHGKPTLLGAATGAVVGLVAITPAAGFVSPMSSIVIGLVVSPICYFGVSVMKSKLGYDDSLDAFGCHGLGGIWGGIATGIFASKEINSAGANGLIFGSSELLVKQLIGIGSTIVLSAIMTFIILKVISIFTSLRVSKEDEEVGLDYAQHGEEAYRDLDNDQRVGVSLSGTQA